MVMLDVIVGAAGAAGFTFGLVRTRRAENKSSRHPIGPEDAAADLPGDHGLDAGPPSITVDPDEDL